ncbi:uncharacterized protein BJ171DRAFT_441565 [Polychytrium aggregatum]|uniref:uncharacterized protein n=1 Tax=Polychytrium aggregatum TaxID=110093 RepID=UPI0022FEFBB1|nr:uncharacterized protein BJ171DRAFT_441565 [Polychytrium aggregatum]KAI9205366.1 hypothetical protein BJ171DRAFT_441565 [Polychytrium aggregatum]
MSAPKLAAHAVRFPKKMPTNWVLKQIALPPPADKFHPTTFFDGRPRPPKISLKQQERIREACWMAGLDPVKTVGLPEVSEEKTVQLPRGSQHEVDRYERQKKIRENMSGMADRIATWRKERRAAKQASKPEQPF